MLLQAVFVRLHIIVQITLIRSLSLAMSHAAVFVFVRILVSFTFSVRDIFVMKLLVHVSNVYSVTFLLCDQVSHPYKTLDTWYILLSAFFL